jgi:ATP-dependent RNA helicase DDX52/ROK1
VTSNTSSGELPSELDFFKYSRNSTGKRKQQGPLFEQNQDKRRKVDGQYGDPDQDIAEPDKSQVEEMRKTKHRVTSKGKNIPDAVDTFEGLTDKYRIPSQLHQNLSKSGYKYPTSIQSHAAPILLKVRIFLRLTKFS